MPARAGLLLAMLLIGCTARERIRAGDGYMEDGRYAAAGRAYAKAVDRRPNNSRALEGAAAAWLADGDPEQALTYARRATEHSDAGAPLYAETLIQLGRGAEAVAVLEGAPEAPARARWLAEALLSTGDLDAALSAATEGQSGGGIELTGLIGWLNARLGNDEAALSIAHRLKAADTTQARADAAAILLLLGDDAAHDVASSIDTDGLVDTWWKQAALKANAGEKETALRQLMWLWAVQPKDARFSLRAGQLLVDVGEPAAARRALSDSLAIDDTGADVWRALARACNDLDEWRCAADARSRHLALQESPTLQDWMAGARAWRKAGDLDEVVALWRDAVKRQDDQPTHYYHLAGSLRETGETDAAVGYARLAWNLAPGDTNIALLLGELYGARAEYESAAAIYRAALQSNPGDSRLEAGLNTVLGYIPY